MKHVLINLGFDCCRSSPSRGYDAFYFRGTVIASCAGAARFAWCSAREIDAIVALEDWVAGETR